jgi:hypothetical protein
VLQHVLLQALEEQLLHLCCVCVLLGLAGICWKLEQQLLLLLLGGWVDRQDVLPAQRLRAQRLDLLDVGHLRRPVQLQSATKGEDLVPAPATSVAKVTLPPRKAIYSQIYVQLC